VEDMDSQPFGWVDEKPNKIMHHSICTRSLSISIESFGHFNNAHYLSIIRTICVTSPSNVMHTHIFYSWSNHNINYGHCGLLNEPCKSNGVANSCT